MSGIGYREVAQVLTGELEMTDAMHRMKTATHAYARRQLTWFRRDARIQWLSPSAARDAALRLLHHEAVG
jgi:tRNA dimethylallyltransferase